MERDPVKVLELIVGLPDARVLGVEVTESHIKIELESTHDEARCSRRPESWCGSHVTRATAGMS